MITLITVLASRFRKEVGVINLMFDHEITLGAGAEFTSEVICRYEGLSVTVQGDRVDVVRMGVGVYLPGYRRGHAAVRFAP